MTEPINLNRFRKQKARAEKAQRAEENRARFGATKAAKNLNKTQSAKDEKTLAGKKLDKDISSPEGEN